MYEIKKLFELKHTFEKEKSYFFVLSILSLKVIDITICFRLSLHELKSMYHGGIFYRPVLQEGRKTNVILIL